MSALIARFLGGRFAPLFLKELRQLKRNRRLMVMLVIPPTIQILLFGFALNPQVENLRLGIVDDSRTIESREVVTAFSESLVFDIRSYYPTADAVGKALSDGDLDAAIVIPKDYAKDRLRGTTVELQLLLDATDSNAAAIAQGYAGRILNDLNQRFMRERGDVVVGPRVVARPVMFFNPGLESSWFISTGLIGTLLVLMGSLVSAGSMVREKETGTIEQLLMTPAEAGEIILAKMAPLILLLSGDIGLALIVIRLAFDVPIRGSLLLLFTAGMLCVLSGVGIGILIATFTKSQQQAQLMSFFVNPPIAMLSGVTTPIESMPHWLQPFTLINPVRHFGVVSRGVLLKGIGIAELWPNVLVLMAIAAFLILVSVIGFRKQLG